MTSVVGIDPSLASTGLARITYGSPAWWVVECDTIATQGRRGDGLAARAERIDDIARGVKNFVDGASMVVLEGPSFGSRGGSSWDRAGLWWRIVDNLVCAEVGTGVHFGVCSPSSRAKFATGRGNADKAAVAASAAKLWPDAEIGNSDEADALVLASMAACTQEWPVPFDMPAYREDALKPLMSTGEAHV